MSTTAELLAVAGAGLTVVLGLAALAGLLVKYALLPWLKEHVVVPMAEVSRQVTVNGHVSKVPTLLDRVDQAAALAGELRDQVDTVVATTGDLATGQEAMGKMLDGHLDRSAGEWGRIWQAINELGDRLAAVESEGESHGK